MQYYRWLLATLNSAREKALEETNKTRKRKRAELTAIEKRDVVAKALDYDLSEEKCVLFLGRRFYDIGRFEYLHLSKCLKLNIL